MICNQHGVLLVVVSYIVTTCTCMITNIHWPCYCTVHVYICTAVGDQLTKRGRLGSN